MYDVSIIVPVYNTAPYLTRCLDSLVGQTLSNIEIVIVDDGSTDESYEIITQYINKYNNILVIKQKNSGLSVARNAGLLKAQGKYILFVDSDDYIEKDSCEKLFKEAEEHNCDIVAADSLMEIKGVRNRVNKKRKISEFPQLPCSGQEFLTISFKQNAMPVCAPYALYKRALIVNSKIYFEKGLLHEDELWTPQIYIIAKKVSYIEYDFYFHCERENSITNSRNQMPNAKARIYISKKLFHILKNKKIVGKKYIYDHLCTLYFDGVMLGKMMSQNKRFGFQTAYSLKNRLKALLYFISPSIYLKVGSTVNKRRQ